LGSAGPGENASADCLEGRQRCGFWAAPAFLPLVVSSRGPVNIGLAVTPGT